MLEYDAADAAMKVADHLRSLFARGGLETQTGQVVDLLPGVIVDSVSVDDGGASVVVRMSWIEQPTMTFGKRLNIVGDARRVDQVATEYADIHLIEAVGTGGMRRAAARPPANDGIRWL